MSTRAIQIEFLLSGLIHPTTYLPLTAGTVYFYAAGTTTAKNVWTEKEKTNAFTSYELTAGGIKQLYGDGIYKILVYDASDTLVYTWDNIKIRAHNYSIISKAAAYTTTADDDAILVNTSSDAVTITFLAAASMEYPITILHTAGTNSITIEPNGDETIDGEVNYSFTSPNTAITIFSDGSNLRKAGNAAVTLIDGATITLANTGLHILDSNATHDLIIKPGSNLTADRTLTVTTGDADRTFSLAENLTIADGGDVTITAVGDARAISLSGNLTLSGSLTVSDAVTIKAADIFPATTCMLFGQASAPTGWTKKTDWDDGAMLVVSSDADGTALADGGTIKPQLAHTHAAGSYALPNHIHNLSYGNAVTDVSPLGSATITSAGGTSIYTDGGIGSTTVYPLHAKTGNNGGGGTITGTSGDTTTAKLPLYQEVIAATKD